jgi:hypothetical protein
MEAVMDDNDNIMDLDDGIIAKWRQASAKRHTGSLVQSLDS